MHMCLCKTFLLFAVAHFVYLLKFSNLSLQFADYSGTHETGPKFFIFSLSRLEQIHNEDLNFLKSNIQVLLDY